MAQTTLNMTAMQAALKQLYDGQALVELSYKNNPLWALIKKDEDFYGQNHPLPVQVSLSAGVSNQFANAQANEAAPAMYQFLVTRSKVYGIAPVDRETLMASASSEGAFLSAVQVNVRSTLRGVTNMLCAQVFRDGTGQVATIGSISTGVITLGNPQDVVNFDLNQKLNAINAGATRGASGFVVAIDRSAGTVTVSATLGGAAATPSGWTAADGLCQDGNYNQAFKGLAAWLPTTAPTSGDSFFGLDRSNDPSRLAGVRYDGSAQSIEEAFIDGLSLLTREGGNPDVVVMGPTSYANFIKAMSGRISFVKVGGDADWSFQAAEMGVPGVGSVKIIQDRSCPAKLAYALQLDTWTFRSLSAAPEVQKDLVTGDMLRMGSNDAGELRVSAYGQLECNAPGFNAVFKLSA